MGAEKDFENKVKKYITKTGGWFVKYWAGSSFTKSGVPDILACINGKFYGIEVKAKTGKPSLLQLINLKKIEEAGGYGLLLYPQDFDGFKHLINNDILGMIWHNENLRFQDDWFKKLNL